LAMTNVPSGRAPLDLVDRWPGRPRSAQTHRSGPIPGTDGGRSGTTDTSLAYRATALRFA
jgi:hypothetical protein